MMDWKAHNHGLAYHLFQGVVLLAVALDLANCSEREVLLCYKCSVTVEKYFVDNVTIVTPLCSKFEQSSAYVIQCPYSTMCLKTISTLHLQNGQEQETITRGCAQQKNTTQVFRNRQWEQEHLVQEVYKEECTEIQSNNFAGSKIVHCYCRGELCNSSKYFTVDRKLISVIVLLSAFLLFRNM
ncbi:uncharacterized protein LOC111598531 [Drosophila hydei]|uniref:Uncharacterized protein LOC111598531 n=1 Tax=Drosophila hydei TaxID=7224 RepID=A0A6J1LVS8_DROHY|nr:uncharacterized protein LOC111598531 [Drosophila hydei]XP_023169584.2 uncharacterized protein LOC111598531 [Drosophila hydei]XP_023169585.2 uncharacterized protein LOC111598531 [Drosophila hydei]